MKDTKKGREKIPSPSRDLESKAWPLDVQIISIVGKPFKIVCFVFLNYAFQTCAVICAAVTDSFVEKYSLFNMVTCKMTLPTKLGGRALVYMASGQRIAMTV